MARKREKAKDFKGTWGKILRYCKKYWIVIIAAIVFSFGGTIFTIVGPDKLSDMTDIITDGISPDTEMLETIGNDINDNIETNMETIISLITQNMASGNPTSIEFNGSLISVNDQIEAMSLMQEGDQETLLEKLPSSITDALYSDIEVDGTTITGDDQKDMIKTLSDIDMNDTEAAMEKLDEMPDSVYSLIEPKMNVDKIKAIALTLVIFYACSTLLSAAQGFIMATVTQKVSKRMRNDISLKINRLPMAYFGQNTTGDILSRVTNDIDTISQSLNQSIGTLVSAVTLLIGSLFMMIKTNWIMALTAVVASFIGFLFMMIIMGKSQRYFTLQQNNLGKLNGHIEETYTAHTVVKAYNGEKAALDTFDTLNDDLRQSGFKAQCLSGMMMPIMTFIGNFGYVAVCVVGAMLAKNDVITFGVIVAFMMYVRLFTQPLSQIAQASQNLQSAAAAGERVFEFLEAEEMSDESQKPKLDHAIQGYVDFEHIKFSYDPEKEIIHDFSAQAKPGQKIAIVGPTGAGKTTMVNLLMRFYEINGGSIKLDGIKTSDMKREDVHSQFCMVLQDTWLFEGTIRENLVYCTENIDDQKIVEACKAVGLDHFIRTLPQGYDTVLNDNVSLSQGQKQQLTIARAMIADKPMLILDEATSSVDTRTELQIQAAMDKLMEGRTSFVIAHRLSTIKNADLILVMNHGDIVESGDHESLLAKNGFYAELYNSQFEAC